LFLFLTIAERLSRSVVTRLIATGRKLPALKQLLCWYVR